LNPWSTFPQARDDTSLFVETLLLLGTWLVSECPRVSWNSPESSPVLEKYWRRKSRSTEVAARLGVSPSTVYALCADGTQALTVKRVT
jgi:hypothetical protein